ncbi:MAG: F0F1 ATP synthase subunit A [Bacteroidetes bacterium]|nr:F0F1 ATP synthase subunit A [Bacteroidota bacterium]
MNTLKDKTLLALILVFTSVLTVFGNADSTSKKKSFDASSFILHHVLDAHDWHILGEGENSIHLPLPIILLDRGLQVFSSNKFSVAHSEHGHDYAVTEDGLYAIFHEKIYRTIDGQLTFDEEGHPTEAHATPLDFSITRNVASMFLTTALLLWLFIGAARAYQKTGINSAPKGKQSFLEPLVLFVRDEIAIPNIGEKKYMKYMPYLLTVFFFIWINNLLGLVPFFPGGSNLTGNIAFTICLSVFTLYMTIYSANKNYWSHIFMPPVPKALYFIMIPIEIVGIFTKPFALMIRLFANMTAGHIVVLSFICIIFIKESAAWAGLSIPMALFISILELLVAALQAFIFTLLSALFIGSAIEEHHH